MLIYEKVIKSKGRANKFVAVIDCNDVRHTFVILLHNHLVIMKLSKHQVIYKSFHFFNRVND